MEMADMAVEPAEPAEPVAVVPDWSSAPLPEGSEFGGGPGGHWAAEYFGGPSLLARALAGFRRQDDPSKWNLWKVSTREQQIGGSWGLT
jgi:hypothetical protein